MAFTSPTALSRQFGWFSIALGLGEIFKGKAIARALGAQGGEGIVRGFGAREIGAGMMLLAAPGASPGMWARVAGDALDLGALGALAAKGTSKKTALYGAFAFVGAVAAADLLLARRLSKRSDTSIGRVGPRPARKLVPLAQGQSPA